MFWREEEDAAVVQAGPSHPQEDPPGGVPGVPGVPGVSGVPGVPGPGLLLGLSWVCAALYCALFLAVYAQLWLLLRSGRRRLSPQSGALFLSLLAAALRTATFTLSSCDLLRDGPQRRDGPLTRWLLHCLPEWLQFCTLCILSLYFTQVMFKAKAKYSPELSKYKVPLRLAFLCLSIFFLVVNLTCALLIQTTGPASAAGVRRPLLARVLVNDFLFTLCAVSLAVCIFRIAKMSSANVYLESKGTSLRQATAMGALLILLFTSRACYNLVVVALAPGGPATPFSYGWYSVSDQADMQEVSGETYVVFAVALLVWELLPTALLVGFFRVQQPNQNLAPGGMINSHSFSSLAYFFDNPRRYDSEDDLTRSINSRSDRASLLSTTPQTGPPAWYGSVPRAGSQPTLSHATAAASAPLLCAYPGVPGHGPPAHHHHNLYSTPQTNGCRHQQSQHCSTPQNRYCSSQNYYCTPTN